MATKKSKAAASNKAVKTVVKSGAGTARAPHSANKEAAAAIPPPRKGKPVVAIDSAAPEVVELQKLVDAGKKPVEPIKAVEPVAAPGPVAVPAAVPAAEKKVPKDRSAAAKRAWVTIRANRAAAAAAKAS